MRITIIDYGAGNVANVQNAFRKLGVNSIASKNEEVWEKSDGLVLPGVGAFGAAMRKLRAKSQTISMLLADGTPFLGICLGMQLLLEQSEESPNTLGLGIFKGKVKRFRTELPVPQIGWNLVEPHSSPLFDGMTEFYAYFVHSYYCKPVDRCIVSATTTYGKDFASAFWQKNIFATQFHPEKSGRSGLKILKNFVKEVRR